MNTASGEELSFPQWQGPLQDLILEFDRARLGERIHHVEGLVSSRLREVADGHEFHRERQALQNAVSIIHLLRRDRLEVAE